MAYKRKTTDVYHIMTNYGYGWETESSYDSFDEAKADFASYREHVNHYSGRCKIVHRRERISD